MSAYPTPPVHLKKKKKKKVAAGADENADRSSSMLEDADEDDDDAEEEDEENLEQDPSDEEILAAGDHAEETEGAVHVDAEKSAQPRRKRLRKLGDSAGVEAGGPRVPMDNLEDIVSGNDADGGAVGNEDVLIGGGDDFSFDDGVPFGGEGDDVDNDDVGGEEQDKGDEDVVDGEVAVDDQEVVPSRKRKHRDGKKKKSKKARLGRTVAIETEGT